MNAIEIENLTKVFPVRQGWTRQQPFCVALEDISLTIKKGVLYTILGPNGAGKSTLIKILAGLLPATKGSLKINGRIGLFTADTQSFWGFLDGWQNLEYFSALQNITGARAKKIIGHLVDLFEMAPYIRGRSVLTYSNGMKQRLLLSRALLNDPDILLLDEPASYLDPVAARKFHLLLRDHLCRELKKTILLSTHQLEEAQEISDTLGLLFQGKLLWEKSAEPFRARQAHLLDEYFQTVQGKLA